jgi:hypothetical protein
MGTEPGAAASAVDERKARHSASPGSSLDTVLFASAELTQLLGNFNYLTTTVFIRSGLPASGRNAAKQRCGRTTKDHGSINIALLDK